VLEERTRAAADFAPDPVHDLRVALRRSRSLADGIKTIDPDPAWKQMKKAGKRLFGSLGELRDVQVMQSWVQRLGPGHDPVTVNLLQFLTLRESELKARAAQAVREFDCKQWSRWAHLLPRRGSQFKPASTVFRHLALEQLTEACRLHRAALRSRSLSAYHRLRIGLKRFRYTVENFLPQQHSAWKKDLKELQDLLGEVHDLEVLRDTALRVNAFPEQDTCSRWQATIAHEQATRIEQYRQRMTGRNSLWRAWRAELPVGRQIEFAARNRLQLWAGFRDPDQAHSTRVARLALQLYDGLAAGQRRSGLSTRDRDVLRIAAMLHDAGRWERERGHHKISYRLISQMRPLLGYKAQELRTAAIAARYHRGGLPRAGQKTLADLSAPERQSALRLAAILRLANAFDADHNGRIRQLQLRTQNGAFVIAAEGYSPRDRIAVSVAAARHMLERTYRRPVIVRNLRVQRSPGNRRN
jgi:CHAD domain-containing protein/HD superfamily phosphodiesterase